MTTPTSNLRMTDIQLEFGGFNPIALSEYYAGGAYVGNPPPTSIYQRNGGVPTGGTIFMGNFLGINAIQHMDFDSPGSYSFVVPSGVTTLYVGALAGGGGGGGSGSGSGAGPSGEKSGAAGGGGSGYYTSMGVAVTPGETLTVVVGAGGAGGVNHYSRGLYLTPPYAGFDGGPSGIQRGGSYIVYANQGYGGTGGTENQNVPGGSGWNPGGGGQATFGNDVKYPGGAGGASQFAGGGASGTYSINGSPGSIGAGGGGGGTSEVNPQDAGTNGGAGGNGFTHLTWGSYPQPAANAGPASPPYNPPAPAPTPAPGPSPAPAPGGGGGGGCVTVESIMFNGDIAKNFHVGRVLYATDPYAQPFQSNTISDTITYSKSEIQPCFRIVTKSGAVLECSSTAPIPTRDNGLLTPENLIGQLVAVVDRRDISLDGTDFKWDEVSDVIDIGDREVQHITVQDQCFWASQDGKSFILHHNIKVIQTE